MKKFNNKELELFSKMWVAFYFDKNAEVPMKKMKLTEFQSMLTQLNAYEYMKNNNEDSSKDVAMEEYLKKIKDNGKK